MAQTRPGDMEDDLNRIMQAWKTQAPNKTFGGMTLAQFGATIKPSFDRRISVAMAEADRRQAINLRNDADGISKTAVKRAVAGVIADPDFGADSPLYEAFGYVRDSERKTGLTRKLKDADKPK